MIKEKKYAIVGGGIGGLTLAIALQQKGFSVEVYENASAIKPLGAGIVLAANAMKAYAAIGIDQEVLNSGKTMKHFVVKDQYGGVLSSTDAEKINIKYGLVNTLTLHRADLHYVLLKQLREGTVKLGKGCVDFKQESSGVTLFFSDGSSSHADYLIAADGIHSVFRKRLLLTSKIRYSGYTCWRAVIDQLPSNFNPDEASESWGLGVRFGIVPLSKNRIYWFATSNAQPNDKRMATMTPSEIAVLFKKFHSPVNELINATRQEQLLHNDILDVVPIKQFAFGNIVLLGDAAHATTPNLGQGACMAIEDAVVLANCMVTENDSLRAFKNFEKKRIARTTHIVKTSYTLGKVGQFSNPLLATIRNAAMRLTPESIAEKQLKFLYDVSFT